jgi:hypothetical protein
MKLSEVHENILSCMRVQPEPRIGDINWPMLVKDLEEAIKQHRSDLQTVKSFIEDMKIPQDKTQFIFLVGKTNRVLKLLDAMIGE